MKKLLSCEFNIDTACVELRYADGEALSLYTPGIEDSFDTTLPMRTEMDWLIYNAPLEYAGAVSARGSWDAWAGGLRGVIGKNKRSRFATFYFLLNLDTLCNQIAGCEG